MQRLGNVDKWDVIKAGKALAFEGTTQRRVRVDVNTAGPASLWYASADGEVTLLALINGRDVIEFGAAGEFSLQAEGNDIWFHSVDGERTHHEAPDAVVFTKMVERAPRNHALERMEYLMRLNMENMRAEQRAEIRELRARYESGAATRPSEPPVAGSAQAVAAEAEQSAVSGDDSDDKSTDAGDKATGGAAKK